MEDLLLTMAQESRALQELRKDVQGIWGDEAARELNRRYFNPHEGDDQQMLESLNNQKNNLDQAKIKLDSAQTCARQAEDHAAAVIENLQAAEQEVNKARNDYDRYKFYESEARSKIPIIQNLINLANDACQEVQPADIQSFLRFGELAANTTYDRNGYIYTTDELGRVQHVSGELKLKPAPRTAHQEEIGHKGLPGDQGGHLIGSRFYGTPEGVNIVPQNANLNNGAWKTMENQWTNALKHNQRVNVDIKVKYSTGNKFRPAAFAVRYEINNDVKMRTFRNRLGG